MNGLIGNKRLGRVKFNRSQNAFAIIRVEITDQYSYTRRPFSVSFEHVVGLTEQLDNFATALIGRKIDVVKHGKENWFTLKYPFSREEAVTVYNYLRTIMEETQIEFKESGNVFKQS